MFVNTSQNRQPISPSIRIELKNTNSDIYALTNNKLNGEITVQQPITSEDAYQIDTTKIFFNKT